MTAQITVHAPAQKVAERVPPFAGPIHGLDADTCVLSTGNENAEMLAAYLGMLGFDFTVTEPPELVAAVRALADRYTRATATVPTPAPAPWTGTADPATVPAAPTIGAG